MADSHKEHRSERETDLGGTSKKDTLKRTFKEFSADNITDWAAALTYIAILFGAELNSELQRSQRREAGELPLDEPFLEPRDTSKLEQ